jgi:hypothetical protein
MVGKAEVGLAVGLDSELRSATAVSTRAANVQGEISRVQKRTMVKALEV